LSHAEALAQLRAGRPRAALALLESRLQQQPADAQGWFLLGACRHALSDLPAAAGAFSRCLSLDPANPEAHLAYISILRATGDARGALAASQQAQARCPGDKRLLYAAALCLEDLGQPDDALSHYDTAIALEPAFEDALHNRGLLLSRLGRFDEALANQIAYVAAHPQAARAHSGLADMLVALGMFGEALEALDAAQRLAPDDVSVRVRKGVALASLRRFDEARNEFSAARAQDPLAVAAYLQRIAPGSDPALMLSPENLFFWQGHRALQRCDWTSWQVLVEELRRLPSLAGAAVEPAVAFIAFHLPLTGAERHAIARHVAAAIESRSPALPAPPARPAGRIKVGVLSPDLREHLNAYLLLPLFEMLDRERFELHAYSLAPDDGSEARARLAGSADQFRDLQATTDEAAAARIRADGIDILLDVGGHTTGGRFGITARRPARVQAAYLGFAGSLGSKCVDYVITDAVAGSDPGEWTEARVFLPNTYYLYDFRQGVPEMALARRDYGLPDDAFVYCAFHKAEKISPDAFALWMDILKRVPRSVLWLLAVPDAAQRNLRRESAGRGVDANRLVFAPFDPRERYLARQRLGDLMLDTIHHSAMTTACDALAAALPVLTLRGAAMASRAGESLLRAAGLPELVAADTDTYAALAATLASDMDRLAGHRRMLAARTGPLFDTAARVREIEGAMMQMWQQTRQRR
jgi:predicted O-linked N-acetylglucosamine transferase (SPINDLY family)